VFPRSTRTALQRAAFQKDEMIMGSIRVNDVDGRRHVLEAVEGWRVMEVIREHGLPHHLGHASRRSRTDPARSLSR
jgi:hypothetical protein